MMKHQQRCEDLYRNKETEETNFAFVVNVPDYVPIPTDKDKAVI